MLSGEIEPSKGDVTIEKGERLSILKQDHFAYEEFTVIDTVIMGNKELYDIMKEKEAIRLNELKKYEDDLHKKGYNYICGIDEAGRGPLAGPVTAGCVILPEDFPFEILIFFLRVRHLKL